jgi:hypothetical protein
MTALFPIGIDEQIACVEREIALRRRVYPRRVADRKMTQALADKQLAAMSAVLDTLLYLRESREKEGTL